MSQGNRGLFEDAGPSYRGMFAIIIAGLLGMAIIIGGKHWGWDQIYVTGGPIAIMLIYAFVLRLPFLRLRDDQSGDNLYYLGFLYTLTSIASSLMQYTAGGDADVIVANFGIAVFTTITGLLLRVAFNQMRSDPADMERLTRLELAESARKMRAELDSATLELKQFHRSMLQSMDAGYTTIKDMTEETLKSLIANSEEFTKSSSERMTQRDTLLVDNTVKLNKAVQSAAKSLDKVATQLEQMQAPETLVKVDVGPAKEALEELTADLTKSHQNSLKALRVALDESRNTAKSVNELVESTKQVLLSVAAAQSTSSAELVAATRSLGDAVTSIRRLVSDLQKSRVVEQPPQYEPIDRPPGFDRENPAGGVEERRFNWPFSRGSR